MPPQYYILYTLSNLLSGRVNAQEQRDRVENLSRGDTVPPVSESTYMVRYSSNLATKATLARQIASA